MPTYPNIKVKLSGTDGNAYALMSRVTRALRKGKVKEPEINSIMEEAMSGDYDHLLQTLMGAVEVN